MSPRRFGAVRAAATAGLVIATAALAFAAPLAAQESGRVIGQVVDAATNRPLAGVQVYIPEAGVGSLTDVDGRFLLLNVPAGEHRVSAQQVGYREVSRAVTVQPGQAAVLNLAMNQMAITLDELVVTGAGVAVEKKKLGNTIATINMDQLETAPVNSFSDVLQGREPGVAVLPSSGYTGEGAKIRIRGSSSLSQLNEPIIYVDGVRVDNAAVNMFGGGQGEPSKLDDINPESIERIEILKGAAAATLYGTEASNGVIQIFTKKGRAGAPRFSFQSEWSAVRMATGRMEPMADFAARACDDPGCTDPDDPAALAASLDRISQRWGLNVQPYEPFELDVLPTFFTTGFGQAYSASASGGGEFGTYYASVRWTDEDGPFAADKLFDPIEGMDFSRDWNRRLQTTANLALSPHEKVKIGINTLYSEMQHETPENSNNIYGVFSSALMMQPRLATADNLYGQPAFATLRENMYQVNRAETNHVAGSMNVNFTPVPQLRLDATFGVDYANDDVSWFRPYRWNVDGYSSSLVDGYRDKYETANREVTADLKSSWDVNLTNDISSTLLLGTQGFLSQRQTVGTSGENFPGPGFRVTEAAEIQSAAEEWLRVVQIGGYAQEQVGFRDWLYATVGGRWDANSAFGEEFNTAFYPKASLSYVPSLAFDWNNPTLSTLRVRAAIGQSGLQPGAFDKLTTYSPLSSSEGPGVRPENLGNNALKPEVSTETEAGAELGLFEDRASLEFTWWTRTTADAMIPRQFPVSGGFIETQLVNIGELAADGFEIGVQGTLLQRENLSISAYANANYIQEEITDMGGAPPLKTGGSYPRYRNFLVEGYAPAAFFGAEVARDLAIPLNLDGSCTEPTQADALAYFSTPRNPSQFKPLAIGNSDFGVPNGALASHNCGEGLLLSYLGKPTPDWAGSFGFTVGFLRHFELNSMFEFKAGNFHVQDLSGMFRRANSLIGRNTPLSARLLATMEDPSSTAQERLDAAVRWAREVEGLSPMAGMNGVYPADFIRWRELSLTYRVPGSFVDPFGLSTATVSLGGRNLALWVNSQYPGMDPEGNVFGRCNEGLDCNFLVSTEGWGIPIPRRFTVTTRFTF